MNSSLPEVAIIGYGRFGRVAAHHLKKFCRVYVADRKRGIRPAPGLVKISIEEACSKRNIILSVPINQLRTVLRTVAPKLRKGSLICDVCSVKQQPVQWMKKLLPKQVSILGTHPLFGPDSAPTSLRGKNIVLCPVRISKTKLGKIHRHLAELGLTIHRMTPAKHDRLMAETLFLTQLIGRGVSRFNLPDTQIATHSFHKLIDIAKTVSQDSAELFRDMYRYNRYTRSVPKRLIDELHRLSIVLTRPSR